MKLGSLVATRGVAELMNSDPQFLIWVNDCIRRHLNKDWGDLCQEDKNLNDEALDTEGRILSRYNKPGCDIYIITEWDRSATTILFPDEY